jgi:hypothetical protein
VNHFNFESLNLQKGEAIVLETMSNIVRAGTYFGLSASPTGGKEEGVLLEIGSGAKIIEWIVLGHVKNIMVALPAGA